MKTPQILGCLLIILSLTLSACEKKDQSGSASSPGEAKVDVAAQDKNVEEELGHSNKAEARQWLKAANHVVFKNDKETISKYVEDFYAAGATAVTFTGIETLNGTDLTATMIVVLPKDSAARAKIFEVGNRVSTAIGERPDKDQGQKYLLYSLD